MDSTPNFKTPVYGFRVWNAEIEYELGVEEKIEPHVADPKYKKESSTEIKRISLPPLHIPIVFGFDKSSLLWKKDNIAVCRSSKTIHYHKAPAGNCTCGLYGYFSFVDALKEIYLSLSVFMQSIHNHNDSRKDEIYFIGLIAGHGQVELHKRGFRAEKAKVLAIAPYKKLPGSLHKKIKNYFANEGIPVLKDRNELFEKSEPKVFLENRKFRKDLTLNKRLYLRSQFKHLKKAFLWTAMDFLLKCLVIFLCLALILLIIGSPVEGLFSIDVFGLTALIIMLGITLLLSIGINFYNSLQVSRARWKTLKKRTRFYLISFLKKFSRKSKF